MLITEEEAKTKACPLAAKFGASQQIADGPGPHCVASQCMAWRYGSDAVKEIEARKAQPNETRPEGFDGFRHETHEWVRYERTPRGYCGLAGTPNE